MSNRKRSNNNEEINEIMKRPRLEEKDETVQKDDKSEEKSVDSSGEKSVDSSGEEKDDSDWHDGDDSFESELEFEEALCRLKDEEPILYDELKNIKDEISKTEPNIRKLLVTPLRLEDKVKLCQYYEIYKTQMPNTFDWLNTRNEYNKLYKEAVLAQEQYEKFT
jgi:hypothetical protein